MKISLSRLKSILRESLSSSNNMPTVDDAIIELEKKGFKIVEAHTDIELKNDETQIYVRLRVPQNTTGTSRVIAASVYENSGAYGSVFTEWNQAMAFLDKFVAEGEFTGEGRTLVYSRRLFMSIAGLRDNVYDEEGSGFVKTSDGMLLLPGDVIVVLNAGRGQVELNGIPTEINVAEITRELFDEMSPNDRVSEPNENATFQIKVTFHDTHHSSVDDRYESLYAYIDNLDRSASLKSFAENDSSNDYYSATFHIVTTRNFDPLKFIKSIVENARTLDFVDDHTYVECNIMFAFD